MTRPAVFLDRDGVLNEVILDDGGVRSPRTRAEFILVEGAVEAVDRLSSAGFLCVVVTNQPDVARGRLSPADADWFAERLLREVKVDSVRECRHDSVDSCECRKPRPGLLLDAAREMRIDLPASWMVGDRLVDMAAAERAGVKGLLIDRWWSERPSSDGSTVRVQNEFERLSSLGEAVDRITTA